MPQPKLYASAAQRQAAYRSRREQARRLALDAKGLPSLPVIATLPGWARWNASFTAAQELIGGSLSEMQGYFDDRSESWQESERGEEHQERMAAVEAVLDAVGDLIP